MTRAELDRAVRILPTSQLAALRLLLRKAREDRPAWWRRWLWWIA